jgi:hypothetical protein
MIISLLFLYTLTAEPVFGQQFQNRIVIDHYASPSTLQQNEPVQGQLNILAVMVEFQPDTNRFTSGNGTFDSGSIPYLENPGTNIDALPHDKGYFEAHLEFAKNYFERISGGQLSIHYQVLPDVYRLDHKMEHYSPIGHDPDLGSLAVLSKDVWELVNLQGELPVSINSHENTAFVIFHAGVGRDINLTGTTLDKTPQDIPSVYLSQDAFRRLLDDPSFSGFDIDNGRLLVNNSLILPRTLSRAGKDIAGNRFVLPLSTNGMVTAQIGSHLGLPDLFNTETGDSGIGRFGLMDGAGIFSYNGLFPPEPSAWEKKFLGWAEPFEISTDVESPVSLPAASLRQGNSIAKIPISSREYFLVENRHRDPDGNGVTLTIRRPDGTYTTQTFTNRDLEFTTQESGFDELLEPGVIVDVSNYDFSLPGGLDTGHDSIPGTIDDRELNGGILIWHIDESVINQKSGHKGINSDPDRRAVNLQEADGAQDIGRPATVGLFQNEVNGSAFDFWWSGNNAAVITQTENIQLYQNRFGPDTTPDNSSNSGAPSFFELYNFSDNLPIASLSIREVNPFDDLYLLIDSRSDLYLETYTDQSDPYWQRYPLALQPYSAGEDIFVMIPAKNGIQFYNLGSNHLSETIIDSESLQQPFIGFQNNLITAAPNPLQETDDFSVASYTFDGQIATELWNFKTGENHGFISSSEPPILDIDGTPVRFDAEHLEILESQPNRWHSERAGGYQSRIENDWLILEFPGGSESIPVSIPDSFQRLHTGILQNSSNTFLFYLLQDGNISFYSAEDGQIEQAVVTETGFVDWPSFADLNGDGSPDILFTDHTENHLTAKNRYGTVLRYFPVQPPSGTRFTGTPLITDLNGDGNKEIIITGQDSYSINLYAFTVRGEPVDGFPLNVGGISEQEDQPVHPLIVENSLIAVSHTGDLKVWEFPKLQNTVWASRYGNDTNNKVSGFINFGTPPSLDFTLLNHEETYNWPNPATDETNLRFQTTERAEIRIKITTMSGRLIYDQQLESRAGLAGEILIDTSSWGSGGYFALVEAKNGSTTERKLINIAIVR